MKQFFTASLHRRLPIQGARLRFLMVEATMLQRSTWWTVLLLLSTGITLSAQSSTPIISGGVQYLSTTSGGATVFQPTIAPVVLVPIGEHWLIESRGTFDEVIFRQDGTTGPYHALTFSSVDYLQLDYLASSHVTITVGEFLTPFNIYNERLGPVWIHNLADSPLIAGIGTRTSSSSDGAMLRGVALAKKNWELNYATYFSALVNARQFGAGRAAGGRVGVFVPRTRFEVGMSYQRFLQDQHLNSWGTYLVWEPYSAPLEVRAEYAHTRGGQGYWLEGAYRFSRFRGPTSWVGRLQAVGRLQQFYLGTPAPDDVLPGADTQKVDFGLNYYLPHNLRLNASYGRQFSSLGNANIWNLQVTYRFLFPLIPGGSK
jgi:hypothetical protein